MRTLILGGGFAGLSAAYHIGHANCLVLERSSRLFGHAKSTTRNGFTWDEGPHVSFTKHDYVKRLFAESVGGEFDEYGVSISNYFDGHWIDHPAQSNLYQIPEPLRTECLDGFLDRRPDADDHPPADYGEWLELAFGRKFAETFPAAYTRKYWTTEPRNMSVEWVGTRVYRPSVSEVREAYAGTLSKSTHYITKVRYPRAGGYQAFGRGMATRANVECGADVVAIDLVERRVRCANGRTFDYDRLISTLPLPVFVAACKQATPEVRDAAASLNCTQLLLINVEVPHPARRHENWMYVYDESKYSTRISFTDKLTAANAPSGTCGVQVEVYGSKYKPFDREPDAIAAQVVNELREMQIIDRDVPESDLAWSVTPVEWANVIFDHDTKPALRCILEWLERHGLTREADDLSPTTDWQNVEVRPMGSVALAGRFGQWKYAWSDDCVLRGRHLSGRADT